MTKDKLKQYISLKKEISDLENMVKKCEDELAALIEEGCVKDKVYGGLGGTQGFVIEGMPVALYERIRNKQIKKHNVLVNRKEELLDLFLEIEKFIESIEDSKDRVILRKVFLEGKTHEDVATEVFMERSSVTKIISKYT